MELMAAISALESLTRPVTVELHTDSTYVRNGITSWLASWKRNGWRTAAKQPVKNADLWQRLEAACARHQVSWHWVKGHNGHPENERADALANRGMVEARTAPAVTAARWDGPPTAATASQALPPQPRSEPVRAGRNTDGRPGTPTPRVRMRQSLLDGQVGGARHGVTSYPARLVSRAERRSSAGRSAKSSPVSSVVCRDSPGGRSDASKAGVPSGSSVPARSKRCSLVMSDLLPTASAGKHRRRDH
jgi:hypothetical protein